MKSKVKISCKKDFGVLLALCLLQAGISLGYLIAAWAIEVWGIVFACAIVTAIVCLLGMRVGLTVDTENRVIIRRTMSKTTKIDFINIRTVEVQKVFLGKAIAIIGDDGKVFDKTRFLLFTANYIHPENFVSYFTSGTYDKSLLEKSDKLLKKETMISKIALVIMAVFQIGFLVFIGLTDQPPAYPIVDIKHYGYNVFWVALGVALIAVIALLVKRKYSAITDFLALILFFCYMPAVLVGAITTNQDYFVSHTDDFANYEDVMLNEYDGEYMHFPKEINGEVIDFSYYYKYFWDSIHELYLEVKYSDEEFLSIYNKYPAKEESYFGEQYEEVELSKYEHFDAEEYEGDIWIGHADCDKILFDKENNTVIYYHLSVTDPFDLEWCKLVQRFDLDIFEYEEYVDAKREENKDKVNQT